MWKSTGGHHNEPFVMPTLGHPDSVCVWACFSSKRVGFISILTKKTAVNEEWDKDIQWSAVGTGGLCNPSQFQLSSH